MTVPDFNFSSRSSVFGLAAFIIWIVYGIWYWRALIQIIVASVLTSEDKILWFLVITFVPIIGLITYWMLIPEAVSSAPIFRRKQYGRVNYSVGPAKPPETP